MSGDVPPTSTQAFLSWDLSTDESYDFNMTISVYLTERLLLRIREALGSYLGPEINYLN
jgi:hypothetical protein